MDEIRHRHSEWLTFNRIDVDWKTALDDSEYDDESDDPDLIDADML